MIKNRNHTVDLIKLFCAFGVIAIHTKTTTLPGSYLGIFFSPICVPFFFMISLLYFIRSLPKQAVNQTLIKIWHRLAVPLLSWSVIYLILIFLKKTLKHQHVDVVLWKSLLYGESAVQLYYLPSLILMQFYIISLYLIFKGKNRLLGFVLLAVSILYHVNGYIHQCFGLSAISTFTTFPQYILFAYLLSKLKSQSRYNYMLIVIGVLTTLASIAFSFSHSTLLTIGEYQILPCLGGIGLTLLCIYLPSVNVSSFISNVSSTSYGVYLCHIIFLEILEMVIEKAFHGAFVYDLFSKIILTFLIFSISIAFTFLIRKISFFKYVLLGEK